MKKAHYNLIGHLEDAPKAGTPAIIHVGGKRVKTSPIIHCVCNSKKTWIETKHTTYTVTALSDSGKAVKSIVGAIQFPVTVGEPALIRENNDLRRTSPVVAYETGALVSRIETRNTIYFVWTSNGCIC